jgi:uncharacterized protein (TIGR02284 family)
MESSEKLVRVLNELIVLDFDAAEAYRSAIARIKDAPSKKMLADFRGDHLRHTRGLRQEVRRLGGKAATGPDYKSAMTRGLVLLAKLAGDKMILRAMKVNENATNKAYEKAADLKSPSARTRAMLKRNLEDERRHRAWIVQRLRELSRKGAA